MRHVPNERCRQGGGSWHAGVGKPSRCGKLAGHSGGVPGHLLPPRRCRGCAATAHLPLTSASGMSWRPSMSRAWQAALSMHSCSEGRSSPGGGAVGRSGPSSGGPPPPLLLLLAALLLMGGAEQRHCNGGRLLQGWEACTRRRRVAAAAAMSAMIAVQQAVQAPWTLPRRP